MKTMRLDQTFEIVIPLREFITEKKFLQLTICLQRLKGLIQIDKKNSARAVDKYDKQ